MKKLLLLLFFGFISLSASSCYSVELWSVKAYNQAPLQTESDCKILEIGSYHANRCGCFSNIKEAKIRLLKYKASYPKAYITKTLRSRFSHKSQVRTPLKKQTNIALSYTPSKYFYVSNDIKKIKYNNELQKNKINIDKAYGDLSSFYGLSLEGKYEQYLNQNYVGRAYTDFEYELKLKFSLFKNGFFGHQKENKIEEKTAKVIYFQNLSVVLKNKFSDTNLMIKGLKSEIDYNYYLSLATLYKDAMQQNKNKLDSGIIQSYKYNALKQKESRFLKSAKIYKRHKRVSISKKIAFILDEVAIVKLKNIKTITQYSQKNSYDIALSRAKMDSLDVSKSYLDTVNMNLYAHRRKVDELGWYNTVGIEGKFPLNFSSGETKEIDKLKQKSYEVVDKSLEKNIKNRVSHLYLDFGDLQDFMKIDKDDIKYLKDRVQKFEDIKKNIVPNLTYEPDEEILIAKQKIIELQRNILLSKINLLKILNEIAYIGNIDDVSYILEPERKQ
ncbi:hypothetical protein [Sulfurimonas sp.]